MDHRCEYCEGIIQKKRIKREALRHKLSFVILEDVPVGVCDRCGSKYYHSSVLKKVADIANHKIDFDRYELVPVAKYEQHQPDNIESVENVKKIIFRILNGTTEIKLSEVLYYLSNVISATPPLFKSSSSDELENILDMLLLDQSLPVVSDDHLYREYVYEVSA